MAISSLKNMTERFRTWSIVFIPCLLWSCLPPWEDMCMVTTFMISQLVFYALSNARGMLFLSTLVLILWTKHIFKKWYRSQVLTGDFFKNLLYLLLTLVLSILAVLFLWMPLYDAYDCAVNSLDKDSASFAMKWRNSVFLVLGAILATSAAAQTDLILRPGRVYDSGIPLVLQKATCWLTRGARSVMKKGQVVYRATRRCLRTVCGELVNVLPTSYFTKYCRLRRERRDRCDGDDAQEGVMIAGLNQQNRPIPSSQTDATRQVRIADSMVSGSASTNESSSLNSCTSLQQRNVLPPRKTCRYMRSKDVESSSTMSDLSASSTSSVPYGHSARGADSDDHPTSQVRRRKASTQGLLPGRLMATAPTTRSQTRLFRMESRGAGYRGRSLRENKPASPLGRCWRRCPDCEN